MMKRVASAFALIVGIIGSGWPALTVASRVGLPSACPAATSARVPTGTTLVLTVPKARDTAAEDAGAVQLCLLTAAGRFTPLYHSLPSGDVALSADRRLLAYRDATYRLHLLRLPSGTDRVIGRGVLPQFSHDGRYLAFVTGDTTPVAGLARAAGDLYPRIRGNHPHRPPDPAADRRLAEPLLVGTAHRYPRMVGRPGPGKRHTDRGHRSHGAASDRHARRSRHTQHSRLERGRQQPALLADHVEILYPEHSIRGLQPDALARATWPRQDGRGFRLRYASSRSCCPLRRPTEAGCCSCGCPACQATG